MWNEFGSNSLVNVFTLFQAIKLQNLLFSANGICVVRTWNIFMLGYQHLNFYFVHKKSNLLIFDEVRSFNVFFFAKHNLLFLPRPSETNLLKFYLIVKSMLNTQTCLIQMFMIFEIHDVVVFLGNTGTLLNLPL